jgi:hypothetical protein
METDARYWVYEPDPDNELSEGALIGMGDDLDRISLSLAKMPSVSAFHVWDDYAQDWIS